MSAHLTDQDCINALATFWYEYHKQPRNEAPEQALERAYVIAQEEALSVEFRSGWYSSPESVADLKPEEFKILLSTGGPACQIVGRLDYENPFDIEIQYQDWGTPWEPLQLNSTYADRSPNITSDYEALEWFCNCFYLGY